MTWIQSWETLNGSSWGFFRTVKDKTWHLKPMHVPGWNPAPERKERHHWDSSEVGMGTIHWTESSCQCWFPDLVAWWISGEWPCLGRLTTSKFRGCGTSSLQFSLKRFNKKLMIMGTYTSTSTISTFITNSTSITKYHHLHLHCHLQYL